ncbi:serine protease 1-like [Schistocerca gregaria]|uniref:serine protease 1-like n=1 Tax=Schistocerca gregaria TaxID=7010 RepID=UPI00211DB9E6|nr:serine protease 1-like [Schistocerca gregaria]XP_049841023.1 serine protease 1-like [Schistocerca gregaria]
MATRSHCALAAALLAAMAATSTQSPHGQGSERITDGKPARLGQFPHQALVLGDGTHICGGSLITTTAVLTTAYCTVNWKKFTIRLGSVRRDRNETTSWIVVAHWVVAHPDYDTEGYYGHNVAVIFLPTSAPLSSFIALVTLPSSSDVNETFVGRTALLSGWGRQFAGKPFSDVLLFSEVTVIPNSVCELQFGADTILESTLCAGNKYSGLCSGDWGGALVLKSTDGYKQIGIASFFHRCNEPLPGAFSRITYYLDWIKNTADITAD